MSRLPIRVRLTLAFTTVVAVILLVSGLVLHDRLAAALDNSIDQSLQTQLAEVSALVRQADTGLSEGVPPAQGHDMFAQVLDRQGRVVDATPQLRKGAALTAAERTRAASGRITVERAVSQVGGPVRLMAAPLKAQDTSLIVVVGAPLADRNEAVASLRAELLVGGPAALLVMALVGYFLAGAALRPVERLRAQADTISASDLGRRLSVPRAEDEIQRLGVTLNSLLGHVEESIERERRFVADASHELRTPLAVLKGELELALRRPRGDGELLAAVRSAREEADHVARLAEDLLVLARADGSGVPVRKAETDVATVMQRVAGRFGESRSRTRPPIRIVDEGVGVAHVDAARLEQALGNLVDNAVTHGGGEVTLVGARRDGVIELHVIDQGEGFPPAFLSRAFERFSRPDAARNGRGSGLGLSIVETIARSHGGTARAQNRTPSGAEVVITLPIDGTPEGG